MTTALATTVQPTPTQLDIFKTAGIAASKYDDAAYDQMATAGGYLPRLTQYTDASHLVKKRELGVGYYLVAGKDDRTPLGEDVDVVPIAWRFKALDTSAGRPVSSLEPDSELFRSIAARAKSPASNCQAGIEYLLWIPAAGKFATYLMGSKTALREAGKVKPFIGCAITLKTHTYENDQHVWQGPRVVEASVPPTVLPDSQALMDTAEKFLNPPDDAGEVAEEVKQDAKAPAKRAR